MAEGENSVMTADGMLAAWAERSGRRCDGSPAGGGLRFAFYGRVSTEDWQDPVTSRVRQREQAEALVRGHGQVVAEFFDTGESRTVAWGCRLQAAALVALLPPVTHDALVLYQEGAYASAKIHGTISGAGAGAGEVARLYAQPFPYKKAARAVAAVTLKASKASYSFTVSPSLATRYWVKLFKGRTATAPVASSSLQNVYVTLANVVTGLKTCARPACTETITLTTKVPGSALGTEMAKQVYAYFALSLSKSGTSKPPAALTRNGGKASISKPARLSATQYKVHDQVHVHRWQRRLRMALERVLEGHRDQGRHRPARHAQLRCAPGLCIDPVPGLTT